MVSSGTGSEQAKRRGRPPKLTPEQVELSPLKFLAALARLIPPPRVHRHSYHGVLAPQA
jgi:hypothetical protein